MTVRVEHGDMLEAIPRFVAGGVRYHKEPHRFCNVLCDVCQMPIYRRPGTVRRNAQVFCSKGCRNQIYKSRGPHPQKGRKGELNAAWKGGVTYRRRRGNYVSVKYVRCPPEFISMARKDGYVMEHRFVMARWVGRALERTEVVHHADHAPLNNERHNLELWPDNRSHKIAEHGRVPEGAFNRCQ